MNSPNETDRPASQFSLKKMLLAVAAIALLLTLLRFAYLVTQVPNDAYAMWAAGDVLLDYMEKNNGRWPSSWDDLRDSHERMGSEPTMIGPFSEIEPRVHIDFSFDPKSAAAAIDKADDSPAFRVVVLRNGSNTHWGGMEPNQRIFDALKRQKFDKQPQPMPAKQPLTPAVP